MKQKAQLLRLVSRLITPTYLFHNAKVVYFLEYPKEYRKINHLSTYFFQKHPLLYALYNLFQGDMQTSGSPNYLALQAPNRIEMPE